MKPKSFAYSGLIAARGCPLLFASAALCILSFDILPWTAAKSPQWLVKFHFTLRPEVGLSSIEVALIIPLNINTGLPTTVPSSGSKNAL